MKARSFAVMRDSLDVDEADGERRRLELPEHDGEPARLDRIGNLIRERARQADACDRRVDCSFGRARRETRVNAHGLLIAKCPRAGVRQSGERDAVMLQEILRRLRRATLLQIRRARAHHAANLADLAGDETTVRQRADAHCEVDVILDQVQRAVDQQQAHVDARVRSEEFSHHRHDVQTAEDDRRCDRELALRRVVLARCAALGFRHCFEDALAVLDVRLSRLRSAPACASSAPAVSLSGAIRSPRPCGSRSATACAAAGSRRRSCRQ